MPTHAPGLTAGAAWQEEGFEKLWRAYGVRTEKAKSRAAFERTIKTPEQFERAVSSAEVWAASAPPAKGGPRMSLAAWLLGERYDEDPPSARWKKNKTGAVSRQAAEEAADKSEDNTEYSEDQSAESAYAPRVWPRTDNLPLGQSRLSVSSAEIDDIDGNKVLRLFYDGTTGPAEGRQFTHSISIVHRDFEEQAHGQKVLAEVCRAVGLAMIEDAEELYRREFDVSVTTDNLLFLFPDQARTLH